MQPNQIASAIEAAVAPAFRDRLLARGQARSMIWRNGELPPNAPRFSSTLTYDLRSYAYSLLLLALRHSEQDGSTPLDRTAFEHAANALEATISGGDPSNPERGFHRLLAACAFHLGRFSARAFSLLTNIIAQSNFSTIERALALFILRSFEELELEIAGYLKGPASDDSLTASLGALYEGSSADEDEADPVSFGALDTILTETFLRSLGTYLSALESGAAELAAAALNSLRSGLDICGSFNLVPQWWCYRLAIRVLDDLWAATFHALLPEIPPNGDAAQWRSLRELFIALLIRRNRAEIELWPSQVDAAKRAVDSHDDLVVSLPTSAGKTRVAELCILKTLSEGKRIIFVTPLRALSAQTEANLHRTFGPLGKTISSVYGSIGTSPFDADTLKGRDIVVATPEKLDFALRSEPALIDDVGLIVLDEGHMIGLGEREVRYEAQIQRLLRRSDADQRRIVCLSAILPSGQEFDDFVGWLRRDVPGSAVVSDWRPTRIRFGEVLWNGTNGRLQLRVDEEQPFVPQFLSARVPPKSKRKQAFPRDQRELVLATAWRLLEDGKSVLIYCPQRRSVEPFAETIVDLYERGLLASALTCDAQVLNTALVIGAEWLGTDHPILACLKLGVAVHHGALPTPFRKEMERLLREGILKITVSSPTLAQGLNLTATALIVHSLHRNGSLIPATEFKNVVGRAGRAFIDVEGLVLLPIFESHAARLADWNGLIANTSMLSMRSGLLRLVVSLLVRMQASSKLSLEDMVEYVVNNATAWDFPQIKDEDADARAKAVDEWDRYLATLDTALLSLVGDKTAEPEAIGKALDEVLSGSLWKRHVARMKSDSAKVLVDAALKARANTIWSASNAMQRKGYFLAGVGLRSGQQLDTIAKVANDLLVEANARIVSGEHEKAIKALTSLANEVFPIHPFVPDPLPSNWEEVLRRWLLGQEVHSAADVVNPGDTLRFVENGLIYKLPWAMEAIRVRAQANKDVMGLGLGLTIDDFEIGLAAPAVETGTLNRSATVLIQAGFTLRSAAIRAVEETAATFGNGHELQTWLNSDEIVARSALDDWPTPTSAGLWKSFRSSYSPPNSRVWKKKAGVAKVHWTDENKLPPEGSVVRLRNEEKETTVLTPRYEPLGVLVPSIPQWSGLLLGRVGKSKGIVQLTYYGPDDVKLSGSVPAEI
ncbi:MAG TPA: DEAD/DEAH box helicase [Steroidobacteraceae bacterium]|jgi:replicative superfamily II helicase